MAASTTLTETDRWAISRARELAALDSAAAVRARALARAGSGDNPHAYVFGEAQHILALLAGLAERLATPDDAAAVPPR